MGDSARLLVSVAHLDEIGPALAGGAEVLDVKDPSRGSLGAADPALVRAARAAAPAEVPVSAALGDGIPPEGGAFDDLARLGVELVRAGASVLKVGLAGACERAGAARALTKLGAKLAAAGEGRAILVAVAFADEAGSGALRPLDLPALASSAGARGVMLDTLGKGTSILGLMGEGRLREWVKVARERGLLCGLAGSLSLEELPRVAGLGADVVGLRGALCEGGRGGRVTEESVRRAVALWRSARGREPRRSDVSRHAPGPAPSRAGEASGRAGQASRRRR